MSPVRMHAPTAYRLRVHGHLDQHWAPWFGQLTLAHDNDGTTTLTGVVADQAQLHGLLTKIRDIGVPLIAVTVIEGSPHADTRGPPQRFAT